MSANMSASRPLTPTYTAAYNHVVMLVGRLLIASLFIQHGYMKLTNYAGTVKYFANWGFPMPEVFAWLASFAEFGGGLLLALGLLTRPAALLVVGQFVVIVFLAHAGDPYSEREDGVLFGLIALFFVCAGAGRYSVDALLRRRIARR